MPSDSRPSWVVDASVAVKWHLRDEEDAEAALLLLADFSRRQDLAFRARTLSD